MRSHRSSPASYLPGCWLETGTGCRRRSGLASTFSNCTFWRSVEPLRPDSWRERQIHARNLLVVTEIRHGLDRHAVLDAAVDCADLEKIVRVEIDRGDIAVGPSDSQLVGVRPVDVLAPEVVELVFLRLVVNQRTGEVGRVLAQTLGIIGRELLGVLAALEWIDLPGLRAVVGLYLCQSLQRGLVADRARLLDERHEAQSRACRSGFASGRSGAGT